jgi:hypothetical protein
VPIFCYSPAVWVYIKSLTSGVIYDVSPDMVRGQTVLRENAPHQIQVTLMNKQRRYDKLFAPNDLFVVYMKRTRRLLVMSGYLDSVPFFSSWESSVQIFGTCTAKRFLQKRWDPSTTAALQLMSNNGTTQNALSVDGGMAAKALALMTEVGGWPGNTIHIGALPTNLVTKVLGLYSASSPLLFNQVVNNVGGSPTMSGNNNPMVGSTSTPQSLPKGVSSSNAAYFNLPGPTSPGLAISVVPYSGSYNIAKPQTPYFCQMNWGYMAPNGSKLKSQRKAWLAGNPPPGAGPVMIYCPTTNKTVLCEVAGDGPGKYSPSNTKIGLSPQALSVLGVTTSMINQGAIVYLAWCDQSQSKDRYPPGPWPVILTTTAGNGLGANGSPTYAVKTTAVGVQQNPFDLPGTTAPTQSQDVVTFVENACGTSTYAYGNSGQKVNGRPSYDSSGLAYAAWKSAGLDWPHLSCAGYWLAGYSGGPINIHKSPGLLIPGDLVFYWNKAGSGGNLNDPNHMGIYIGTDNSGNDKVVEASASQKCIHQDLMNPGGNLHVIGYGRPSGYPGFQNLGAQSTPGSANTGVASAGSGAAVTEAGVTSFINYWDWFGQAPSQNAALLTGVLGLMNDQPFLPFINTVLNSSMRSWCTGPNGDFISWFPDYFGAYGRTGSITVEDVELMDFSIAWSDQTMVTHQYVSSTWVSQVFGPSPAGTSTLANMATTEGVVTLEMGNISNNILQMVLGLQNGDTSGLGDPQKILNRFGARSNFQQIGVILGPAAQFFYALFLFQLNWASMFTCNVPTTFMPEAFPGMLLRLPSHDGLQVYINQVTHSWDLTDGGPGFTTQMAVMAPSNYTKGGGLHGVPLGSDLALV